MSTSETVLDVRGIDEPPFDAISDALDGLDRGTTLVLINAFEPRPLYDVLEERGFTYATDRVSDDEWRVEIEHA